MEDDIFINKLFHGKINLSHTYQKVLEWWKLFAIPFIGGLTAANFEFQ